MVYKKIAKMLAEIIDADYEDITQETELTTEYGIEAVNVAKLVIQCEKYLKIIIHDEDVHNFKRVKDIAEYIEEILSDN